MARLLTCGWESGAIDEQLGAKTNGTGDASAVVTTPVRSGTYALKISWSATATGSSVFTFNNTNAFDTNYVRFYLYYTATPTVYSAVVRTFNNTVTAGTRGGLYLNANGTLQLYSSTTTTLGAASAVLSTSAWHLVEMQFLCDGANQTMSLTVDGTSVASGVSFANTNFDTGLQFGWSVNSGSGTRTGTYYLDDLAINDTTGSAQTASPGDSKIILLKPVADSARGNNWTTSGGATTNLWDNVDNTPPTGIADTTANAGHQIRNAANTANSSYDAQVTDYATAGIAASDTINVVYPIINTGAPSATSPKLGTLQVVSNPAGTVSGQFNFYNSVAAAGTFPTGWKWLSDNQTPPSVTVVYGDIASGNRGTRPVLRVTQVTASTRIALVDFMGLYVDYTPVTSSPQTVSPVGIESAETPGAAKVQQVVSPAGVESEETLGASQTVPVAKPAGIRSDEAVGNAAVKLTIAPAGIPCEERFGSVAVTQVIRATGIATGEVVGSPAVTPGAVTLSPAAVASEETLGRPTVAPGTVTVSPSGIGSEESVGIARLSLAVRPTGIESGEVFGSATATPGAVTISPAGTPSEERLGAPTATPGAVTVAPVSCPSGEAFGQATVTVGAVTLAPQGIPSDETIGAARLSLTIAPAGIRSEESAGNTAVKPVIAPAGIGSTESVGTPRVTLNLAPVGIGSGEAFGVAAIVPGAVTIEPAGIGSEETAGAAVVTTGALNLAPAGIPSTEQFGSPTVTTGAVTLNPAGIPSDELLGSVSVSSGTSPTQTLNLVGIPGGEAIGNAAVEPGTAYITPPGIPTDELCGAPTVTANLTLAPVGIPSAEQFGSPTVTPGAVTLQPVGIPGDELVGAPRLSLNLAVAGIPGDETLGAAQIQLTIHPVGIGSDETFGTPGLLPGAVTIFATAIVSTEEFGQVTVGIFITAWPPHAGAVVITSGASGTTTITNVSADVDITTGPTGAPTTEPVATGDVTASRGATGSLELV